MKRHQHDDRLSNEHTDHCSATRAEAKTQLPPKLQGHRLSSLDLESELQAEGENSLEFNGSFEGENSLYEPSPPSSPKAQQTAPSDQRALKLSEHKGKVPSIAGRVACLCACVCSR